MADILRIRPDGSYYYEKPKMISRVATNKMLIDSVKTGQKVEAAVVGVVENVKDGVITFADVLAWLAQNWKITLVGVVALLFLLKD